MKSLLLKLFLPKVKFFTGDFVEPLNGGECFTVMNNFLTYDLKPALIIRDQDRKLHIVDATLYKRTDGPNDMY